MAASKLRWGIMGTGNIAKKFALGVQKSRGGQLTAVGSRSQAQADAFGREFAIARCHPSYEALLADPEVDAVYISMPHPLHAEWTIRACEARKHVLVEKPMGINHAEAMAMVEAARRNDVFLMEAFMYRCHPQTKRLVELVRQKAIGDLQLIEAHFAFRAAPPPEHRLLNPELAGGGIMDVGCYPVSMSRLLAGAANGQPFVEPLRIDGAGVIGETGVDDYAAATALFPGGIIAHWTTGVRLRHDNVLRLWGTEGSISVPLPWIPAREGGTVTIHVQRHGEEPREIRIDNEGWLYAMEADAVADHLARRQAPEMSWEDSLGNMRALDRWRECVGLVYPMEKPDRQTKPVHGRPLRVGGGGHMRYGRVPGVDKPISRLVMGCDNQPSIAHASVMFDDYVERGGTCFDTAYVYGGGRHERLLGQWVHNRNLRDKVVIIGKGAHTPLCTPEHLTAQLHESLERLQTDHVDIYMMHRDNPAVPVGEFVDVLDDHVRAGRIRCFGGSNWSIERFEAANAYAKANGKRGFEVLSNNFSLARMVEPPWAGCISASDPASRAWFQRTQTALFAWSSQARGFFTDRAKREGTEDRELVRCWFSEDNWQRRDRAIELAKRRNVSPINIALAYVLAQPFPTFALIGPRTLAETRTTWPALDVGLSADELAWLDLER